MRTQPPASLARYHHTMTTGNEPTVPDDTPSPGPQGDPNAHPNDRDRNSMGRFTRTLASVRRDTAAVEYLADHPGTTYEELKERFGYAHRSDAKKGIERAKADVARPAVMKLIAAESEELDALYAEACAILQRSHVTVSHGKVIKWLNPETQEEEPLPDDGPRLAAIRLALDVRKAYQDLHGLKRPARVEATITEVTQQDIELAELIREAEAKNAAEEARIKGGNARE